MSYPSGILETLETTDGAPLHSALIRQHEGSSVGSCRKGCWGEMARTTNLH